MERLFLQDLEHFWDGGALQEPDEGSPHAPSSVSQRPPRDRSVAVVGHHMAPPRGTAEGGITWDKERFNNSVCNHCNPLLPPSPADVSTTPQQGQRPSRPPACHSRALAPGNEVRTHNSCTHPCKERKMHPRGKPH